MLCLQVRLLLACAFLPLQQLSELHAELSALADTARSDDDEWVRVVAAAVGNLDGQLDMASVTSASSLVYQSLDGLWAGLAGATPPSGYRPLQVILAVEFAICGFMKPPKTIFVRCGRRC